MTKNNKAFLKNSSSYQLTIEKNIVHRFIDANAKIPNKCINEKAPYEFFLPIEDAYLVVDFAKKYYINSFFKEHNHLEFNKRLAAECLPYTNENDANNLMLEKFIMAYSLIDEMKMGKMEMLCIDEETAYYAFMLTFARTRAMLTKQFLEDVPNGESQLSHDYRSCLILYARTPDSLTREFWDNLPSSTEQFFKQKKRSVVRKALCDLKMYVGMNNTSTANVVLFARNIKTAITCVNGYKENDEVEGVYDNLPYGVKKVQGGVIEKLSSVDLINF